MKRDQSVVKGCEKRILLIKSPKSELFEEAYFILKPQGRTDAEIDMVAEAEKLLKEAHLTKRRRVKSFSWDDVLIFMAGVFFAGVILALGGLFF